jgi:hypothetical protein
MEIKASIDHKNGQKNGKNAKKIAYFFSPLSSPYSFLRAYRQMTANFKRNYLLSLSIKRQKTYLLLIIHPRKKK